MPFSEQETDSNHDDLQAVEDRADQNGKDADRCKILGNQPVKLFTSKIGGNLHLVGDLVHTNEECHKDAGKECNNGHQDAVGNKVKEVQDGDAQGLGAAPQAMAQRGR